MKKLSRASLLSILAFAAICPACLNDRDTLADEARKNRDVLTTLVGGFERNPPLYYEMRIKRIEGDLAKNPKLISEYDDIAVANDRIGNDDEAIKWIELKKKQLSPLDMKSETSRDDWYKYYANCGTFWVHRWAKHGAKTSEIKNLEHGRDLIGEALKINPNAHFGREKYQQMVVGWLIDSRIGKRPDYEPEPPTLADYVNAHISRGNDYRENAREAVIGLSGLIRLGGAWQSPDIYWAIGSLYYYPEQAMADVAVLRAQEIVAAGGRSMDPGFKSVEHEEDRIIAHPELDQNELAEYKRLRRLADKWNDDRQAFMLDKLKKGDHPDTDPHFWDGAPQMPDFSVKPTMSSRLAHATFVLKSQEWLIDILILCIPVLVIYAIVRTVRGYRREFPKKRI